MKNKPTDTPYCNVDKNLIKNARPKLNQENLKHLYDWITERYKIHLKKDILKKEKPWTSDKILQKYRFCNVRREHDKETKWLIKNLCQGNLTYKNKILNITLFRLINKSKTIEIFGPIDFSNPDLENIKQKIKTFENQNPSYIYFSNAFFTSGPKTAANKLFPEEPNMVIKIIKLAQSYNQQNIVREITKSNNPKQVFEILKSFNGLGDFLAYQIFVDFTYIPEFPFSENEFVIAGPGCKNGLNLIFEDLGGLGYEEALFWLRDNQNEIFSQFNYNPKELFSDLPEEDRHLNIMSLENCMCEISKYLRALSGSGRPRIRYNGK